MKENALIIGAGLGLSASLARLLTKNNFNVAIAARNIEKLENLKNETNSKVFQCDASNIEDVENLFKQSDKLLGAPNLVIYNPSARVRGGIAEVDPVETPRVSFCCSVLDPWAAISFTPLRSKPRLVMAKRTFKVAMSKLAMPIPAGPINKAINLERSKAIMMLANCTPPKRDVALSML